MKQEINGIKKSKTIKEYIEKDNTIEVVYLDGSKDIFEKNTDNLKLIIEIMEKQANIFNEKNGSEENKTNLEKKQKVNKIILIGSTVVLAGTIITTGLILTPITIGATAIFGIATAGSYLKFNKQAHELDDINKYKMYLENKPDLEDDYSKIISKERIMEESLIKSVPNRDININTIDKFTADDIDFILEKVNRYHSIDKNVEIPKTPDKRKSLSLINRI